MDNVKVGDSVLESTPKAVTIISIDEEKKVARVEYNPIDVYGKTSTIKYNVPLSALSHPDFVGQGTNGEVIDGEVIAASIMDGSKTPSNTLPSGATNLLHTIPSKHQRPTLGLIPRYLRDAERQGEIAEAIIRYSQAGEAIPKEWLDEYNELVNREANRKNPLRALGL